MSNENKMTRESEELVSLIKACSMSDRDRFWIRDDDMIRMTGDGASITKITADNIISVPPEKTIQTPDMLTKIAILVMTENPGIKALQLNRSHYSKTLSMSGETIKPYVDDIAQIIGIDVKNCHISETKKILRLFQSRSAVAVRGEGILCSGSSPDDAEAVAIIAEKAAFIHVRGSYIGKVNYIGRLESALMRFVYRRKYSKQAKIAVRV